MSKLPNNPKKTSTAALIVILLTIFIAVFAGQSEATTDSLLLEKVLQHKVENEKLSLGVAAVVINNGQVEFINLGVTDQQTKQKVSKETLFEIGSISKVFTATALASYVKKGKVNLDDSVQVYLPGSVTVPSKNDSTISFKNLANHHSGLPRLPTNMPFADPLNPYADYTTDLLYEFLNGYELPRNIGELPEYSNLGMGLLGHTLSVMNNSNYETMLKQEVLVPLKMEHTYVDVPKHAEHERSQGHNSALNPTKFWQLPALAGAGAIVSNASDMAIFLKANMEQSPIQPAISLTHKPTAEFGSPTTKIGLAWLIQNTPSGEVYMHNGQTGGFASFIGFNPNLKRGIVLLSNVSTPLDEVGYAYLSNTLESVKLAMPIELSPAELEKLTGVYELAAGFNLSITQVNGQLFVQGTGQPQLELRANSPTEFINAAVQARIVFEVNTDGVATSLTLYQGGQTLKEKKLR